MTVDSQIRHVRSRSDRVVRSGVSARQVKVVPVIIDRVSEQIGSRYSPTVRIIEIVVAVRNHASVDRPPGKIGSRRLKRAVVVAQIIGPAVGDGVDLTAVGEIPDRVVRNTARGNAVAGAERRRRSVVGVGYIEVVVAALDGERVDFHELPAVVVCQAFVAEVYRRSVVAP